MTLGEAVALMRHVQEFELADWDEFLEAKEVAADELAEAAREYVEREAELCGWHGELMEAIGESG